MVIRNSCKNAIFTCSCSIQDAQCAVVFEACHDAYRVIEDYVVCTDADRTSRFKVKRIWSYLQDHSPHTASKPRLSARWTAEVLRTQSDSIGARVERLQQRTTQPKRHNSHSVSRLPKNFRLKLSVPRLEVQLSNIWGC